MIRGGNVERNLISNAQNSISITPEFVFINRAKQVKPDKQVILQLGCIGSRLKISYGTTVPINICGITNNVYFDLVNIDQYDCIIRTPFMNTYGVCLDFNRCCWFSTLVYSNCYQHEVYCSQHLLCLQLLQCSFYFSLHVL